MQTNECVGRVGQASLAVELATQAKINFRFETILFTCKGSCVIAKVSQSVIKYKLGCLDLNNTELALLKKAIKTNFSPENEPFKIESKYVILDNINRTMSIERITEIETVQIDNDKIDIFDDMSNTERIQFCHKKPLMAKYKNKLYFVDSKLEREYLDLLTHTDQIRGTAIRIKKDRVKICNNSMLSINKVQPYDGKKISVIKVPESFENNLRDKIQKYAKGCEYNRFLIRNYCGKNVIHRVDPVLLHSSKYDISTDIYADSMDSNLISESSDHSHDE